MEDGTRSLNEEEARRAARPRVAIVGGGWAGCAAAVRLVDAGVGVTLYEQAPHLGGRARSVPVKDHLLDNGQHLLVGAYEGTLRAIAHVHGGALAPLFHELPLTVRPFGSASSLSLRATAAPAPWNLAAAVLGARGLSLRDRFALVGAMRGLDDRDGPADTTVRERYADLPPALYRGLWEPLCLAALNTPAARASSRIFANVLRIVLRGSERASHFLVPRAGLSELLPDAAARYITARGAAVQFATRVRSITADDDGVALATSTRYERLDHVIIAVAPHQLAQLDVQCVPRWAAIKRSAEDLHYESINTVHLGYTQAQMRCVIERLDDAPGQWIFDGGTMSLGGERLRRIAVVISGSGSHDTLPQDALIDATDAQLRRLSPSLGALRFAKVFAERRATFACEPGLARPAAGPVAARVHLAGDYTHPDLPGTLESAVQTASIAAAGVLDALAADRAPAAAAS